MVMTAIFSISCSADMEVDLSDNVPWDGVLATSPSNGSGDFLEINNAANLAWLATANASGDLTRNFKFMVDINMNNRPFAGIERLSGMMDGNNKTIRNLKIDRPDDNNIGLIRVLGAGVEIKNLTIESGSIVGDTSVGAFVGRNEGTGNLEGLVNKASVEGNNFVGGIIGTSDGATTLINIGNAGDITATGGAGGGIIGSIGNSGNNIKIQFAYNYGVVAGSTKGRIVGQNLKTSTITIDKTVGHTLELIGDNSIGTSFTGGNNEKVAQSAFINRSTFSNWDDFDSIWK